MCPNILFMFSFLWQSFILGKSSWIGGFKQHECKMLQNRKYLIRSMPQNIDKLYLLTLINSLHFLSPLLAMHCICNCIVKQFRLVIFFVYFDHFHATLQEPLWAILNDLYFVIQTHGILFQKSSVWC